MSIPPNDNSNNLSKSIRRERFISENPIRENIKSGIYRAITTGQPDPEGRGRLAAYVPKLGGDPDNPMFFQYASPMGGSNASGSYGMFSVPPDSGITILIFFAENGELSEGYWFAVAQEVPNVLSGGPSGPARADGTGQGEGAFADVPSADIVPTSVGEQQDGNNSENNTDDQPTWTTAETQTVEYKYASGESLDN